MKIQTEATPAGPQTVIPGAEARTLADVAKRRALAPLAAKAPQKPADVGLFGDSHKQADFLDKVRL